MLDIRSFINRNNTKYPLSTELDIYKLIYQNNLLVGHLLKETDALSYLDNEILNITDFDYENNKLLYEYISSDVVRVNIITFINSFSKDLLIDLFMKTSLIPTNEKKLLDDVNSFNLDNIYKKYLDKAPSHSEIYRNNYFPHYRIIASQLLSSDIRAKKFQKFIDNKRSRNVQIIALEGRCGSGKTTISKMLNDCTIIELDDHFDGGSNPVNVEYITKLLTDLKNNGEVGKSFTEKCFDCQTLKYYNKVKQISNIIVVEGVYGYLEVFRKYFDYLAFCVVSKDNQLDRLKQRSNYLDYINKWIPREEKYFNSFDFITNADILI